MKKTDLALAYYELGLRAEWPQRFGEYRKILALDYLRMLRRIEKGELETTVRDFARARLATLNRELKLKKADLVITITWNTDGTDVDLHVVEPSGEKCYYQHKQTKSGGRITQDVTRGYGPEMYTLVNAPDGPYSIKVNYFGRNRNRASTRTKVFVTVYQDWGTSREEVIRRTVTLGDEKEMRDVVTVKVWEQN